MPAPAPTLAFPWTTQKVAGYWMSEKFDGVRMLWTGRRFVSRTGKTIKAPVWFTRWMPKGIALDGELWHGHGGLNAVQAAIKSQTHYFWGSVIFQIFDLPEHPGTFEDRQAALAAMVMPGGCRLVRQELCEGMHHMKRRLREIADGGGEGLMLREAGSKYVAGRSHSLLKVRVANNSELIRDRQTVAA